MRLQGKKIAILIARQGTEEPEFVEPKRALENEGAQTTVVGTAAGDAQTVNADLDPGGIHHVDQTFADVSAAEFDGVVIPGGTVGADRLRGDKRAVDFVRSFFEQSKPVGAICHGPWMLVEAGVLDDRRLTSFPTLRTDIENAGGQWRDEEVIVDQGLVTSRKPDDLPAFCGKLVEEFEEGPHSAQARSA